MKQSWVAALFLALLFSNVAASKEFSFSQKPPFYVLASPGEASGMFSVFLTTLGFLHHYEMSDWAGVQIDFGQGGLYYRRQKRS